MYLKSEHLLQKSTTQYPILNTNNMKFFVLFASFVNSARVIGLFPLNARPSSTAISNSLFVQQVLLHASQGQENSFLTSHWKKTRGP